MPQFLLGIVAAWTSLKSGPLFDTKGTSGALGHCNPAFYRASLALLALVENAGTLM
jgi:hypothetical protein